MTCWSVRRRLSAYVDSDLPVADTRVVAGHLAACPECERRHRSLRRTVDLLAEMPKLNAREALSSRVRDRLEVERRGPGLALVFRTFRAGRPLILPSLIPAMLVVVVALTGALLLDGIRQRPAFLFTGAAGEGRSADSGTEANPLFPTSDVSLPQARGVRALGAGLGDDAGEGSFFLETVVARDGTVSAVTLLDGDSQRARPIVDALRRERFEPVRLNGRRVAVSVYRLISRLEVRAPLT
jgi:hypothetical protein